MVKYFDFFVNRFPFVSGIDFYRELFPEGELQEMGVYHDLKCNGIAIEIFPKDTDGNRKVNRYTVNNGLESIKSLIWNYQRDKNKNFCIISPISYMGRERTSSNARFMYALCVEIDNLIEDENDSGVSNLIEQVCTWHNYLPKPTFIVCSGSGVHLYYQFVSPLPLFKSTVESLSKYKRQLTDKLWNKKVTHSYLKEQIQYESIFQAFRMVGTASKLGEECSAFRVGEPVSISYLNQFVAEENKIIEGYKSNLTLNEAREKYPQWYERRIVQKQDKGHWVCKRDLYDWWKRRIFNETVVGHRYYCLMCLSVYAKKSGISFEELERDCFELMDTFELLTKEEENHFTEKDVIDALQIYRDDIFTYPINSIVNRSGLSIEKNRRNGRKRNQHLEVARAIQEIKHKYDGGNWRNTKGQKTKKELVENWKRENPSGTMYECAKELGISYPTTMKWWKEKD